ncbi:outer membrane protein [Nitrospina watsonii]|uniref:Outer surface protein n=1 Tax=Nitrospina watsonii TaxID=1323948 RepID=A0ABM9HFL1_9BACT|nr:outer membrane beta-barrel protein [Nitrospina watsonii]CAI2719118.1 Putative Outer surface protein [Nitrospina watsonii]
MKRLVGWMAGLVLGFGVATAWAGSPYASAKFGGTGKFDNTLGGATLQFNTGISFLTAVGYEFEKPYRLEIEMGYNHNTYDGLNSAATVSSSGSFGAFTTMVNAYYDIPLKIQDLELPVTPYVGAGVGLAVVRVETNDPNFVGPNPDSDTDLVPGWQAMLGFQKDVGPRWTITGEFRLQYLQDPNLTLSGQDLSASYETQQVLFGARYRF